MNDLTVEEVERATQLAAALARVEALETRLAALEERTLSYYKNRWDVVDKLVDYLVGAELPGDYCEFGVFKGTTFSYFAKLAAPHFPAMKFVAFDSFAGLPALSQEDFRQGYSSGFFEGQFTSSKDIFLATLTEKGVPMDRVSVVPGWFDQTLVPGNAQADEVRKISAAWIDCDLYTSTIPVLDYLTPRLSVGSVLLFDDWRCFRNQTHWGQQRACAEWLARNGQIRLNEFVDFGFHGVSFTVAAC